MDDLKSNLLHLYWQKRVICFPVLASVGGLYTSIVVKYTDNIMKGFSAAAAIVLSTVASVILFGLQISACLFAIGLGRRGAFPSWLGGLLAGRAQSDQSHPLCLLWIPLVLTSVLPRTLVHWCAICRGSHMVPNDLCFQRHPRLVLLEASCNLRWKGPFRSQQLTSSYRFTHESLNWCSLVCVTAVCLRLLLIRYRFLLVLVQPVPNSFLSCFCKGFTHPCEVTPADALTFTFPICCGQCHVRASQQLGWWLPWWTFLGGDGRLLCAALQLQRIFSLMNSVSDTVPSGSCSILHCLVSGIF